MLKLKELLRCFCHYFSSHLCANTKSQALYRQTLLALLMAMVSVHGHAARVADVEQEHYQEVVHPAEWMDSNQRIDAFFIESEHELDQLLGLIMDRFKGHFISYIQKPSDLDKDELVSSLTFTGETGERLHHHQINHGHLFSDEPVLLIVDFRNMKPTQTAELNELFDSPARFRGKELPDYHLT